MLLAGWRKEDSWEEEEENTADFTGLGPSIPEDMYCLIKKAVSVRKHLERNRADKDAKLSVISFSSPEKIIN